MLRPALGKAFYVAERHTSLCHTHMHMKLSPSLSFSYTHTHTHIQYVPDHSLIHINTHTHTQTHTHTKQGLEKNIHPNTHDTFFTIHFYFIYFKMLVLQIPNVGEDVEKTEP